MELLAILIGIRSLRFTLTHLRREVSEIHLWSDSMIALSWVNSQDIQPVFVDRRLKEIRSCPNCTFHFVRTAENPADVATRGATPDELSHHPLWWKGPPWLSQPSEQWPDELTFMVKEGPEHGPIIECDTSGELTLLARTHSKLPNENPLIDPTRVNSWTHLVRVTLFVLRFLSLILQRSGLFHPSLAKRRKEIHRISTNGPFTAEDAILAEKLFIRMDQMDDGEEFHRHQTITDEDGILRLRSRLEMSDQPFGFSHPIILSRHSSLVDLIILHCHRRRHHLGVDSTLTEFLSEYWTPHARQRVK